MGNKYSQEIKGNDNIQQKVENQTVIVYNNSLSEEKVREISANNAKSIIQEYYTAAQNIADKRMKDFEEIVIKRLQLLDDKFACFQDPSFNLTYRQAQIQSATTDSESSHKILSELLVHRHNKKDNKITQTGIHGAINIVEQLSNSTLSALTVITCIAIGVKPIAKTVSEALNIMETLFSSIITSGLPQNNEWLEQLDILNAIRIKDFSKLKPYEDVVSEQYDGLVCTGINKDSENYKKALELQAKLGFNILVENELKEGFYRLPIISKNDIYQLKKTINNITISLTDEEKNILLEIFSLYDKSVDILKEIKEKFIIEYDKYNHLKEIHNWWNSIETSFNITSIGKILGHANAQYCYPGFPPLD